MTRYQLQVVLYLEVYKRAQKDHVGVAEQVVLPYVDVIVVVMTLPWNMSECCVVSKWYLVYSASLPPVHYTFRGPSLSPPSCINHVSCTFTYGGVEVK